MEKHSGSNLCFKILEIGYFDMLSVEIQDRCIEESLLYVNQDNCDVFMIQACWCKFSFVQAVKVINKLGYPKNKKAIPYVLKILMDVNWPGAKEAINVLAKVDKSVLIHFITQDIQEAYDKRDDLWLLGIQELVRFAKIDKHDFLDENLFDLLEYSDGEW